MSAHVNERIPARDLVAEAIAALTTVARQRRTVGAGTAGEHTERADFGEIICRVVTAVAANLGGAESLLSGRPGSWEADYVRQIVRSTAGDDQRELMRHRTEPWRIVIDIDEVLTDLGIYQLYEEAADELARRVEDAEEALLREAITPEEQSRLAEIQPTFADWLAIESDAERARAGQLRDEAESIIRTAIARAERSGDPLFATLASANVAEERLENLWRQDQAAYREAYMAAIHQALGEQGVAGGVEFVDVLSEPASAVSEDIEASYFEWEITDQVHRHAQATARLPMTSEAPDWTEGTPADALRRAGVTYLARATAARRVTAGESAVRSPSTTSTKAPSQRPAGHHVRVARK